MHNITSDLIFARSEQGYTLRIFIEFLNNFFPGHAFPDHPVRRIQTDAKSMAISFYSIRRISSLSST